MINSLIRVTSSAVKAPRRSFCHTLFVTSPGKVVEQPQLHRCSLSTHHSSLIITEPVEKFLQTWRPCRQLEYRPYLLPALLWNPKPSPVQASFRGFVRSLDGSERIQWAWTSDVRNSDRRNWHVHHWQCLQSHRLQSLWRRALIQNQTW